MIVDLPFTLWLTAIAFFIYWAIPAGRHRQWFLIFVSAFAILCVSAAALIMLVLFTTMLLVVPQIHRITPKFSYKNYILPGLFPGFYFLLEIGNTLDAGELDWLVKKPA